jgi:dihydrodipicolinate synthase/N-acetylneuraminate lyase
MFATTNPIPVKWAMREAGFAAGECRLPLDAMPESLAQRTRSVIAPFLPSGVAI